jgi:hypothetical protein
VTLNFRCSDFSGRQYRYVYIIRIMENNIKPVVPNLTLLFSFGTMKNDDFNLVKISWKPVQISIDIDIFDRRNFVQNRK